MNERKVNTLQQLAMQQQTKPEQFKMRSWRTPSPFNEYNSRVSPGAFVKQPNSSFKVPLKSSFGGLLSYGMNAASPLLLHYGRKALGGFDQQNKQ